MASTGVISGTPTTAGTVSFTVQVKDAANNTGTKCLEHHRGSTATNSHDDVTAWRDDRHSILNNTAGEWWYHPIYLGDHLWLPASGSHAE